MPLPRGNKHLAQGRCVGLRWPSWACPRVWRPLCGRAVLTLSGTERGCRQLLPTQLPVCVARGQAMEARVCSVVPGLQVTETLSWSSGRTWVLAQ